MPLFLTVVQFHLTALTACTASAAEAAGGAASAAGAFSCFLIADQSAYQKADNQYNDGNKHDIDQVG